MRVLITGAKGKLGSLLVEQFSRQHEVIGADVDEFDISDYAAARQFIGDHHPDWVLHPAAWTDVDGCARDPERAVRINGIGAQNVALSAAAVNAAMLYISSNEVFDGRADRPYTEYDPTAPINPYGYSKWYGERALLSHPFRCMIVRTAWLFAHGGRNFIQAILAAAEAGKPLRVVVNEVANPTYTNDLAEALVHLVASDRQGIYHLVNEGACSRYAFARYALDRAGYSEVPIMPISSHQWPRPSLPPVYTPLANLAASSIGVRLRPWQQAVDAFLEKEGLLKI